MITDKASYKEYVRSDLKAYDLKKVGIYNYFWMDMLRFQLRLRKIEYYHNVLRSSPFARIWLFFLQILNHRLGMRLGFTIPKNVFGPGLCLVHVGPVIVSPKAKVGKNCRIHPGTCIGANYGVPVIGDNVYIGPGAKLYGDITIGNNVAIGANAVVNTSFGDNVTIGGIPAKVISQTPSTEQGLFPPELISPR